MIDADNFNAVNDQHGHATGDAVLRHLAAGLRASFRSRDLVARIGGEEFVALLPATSEDEATAVAGRLCASIAAQAVHVEGVAVRYTVSAGVAVWHGPGSPVNGSAPSAGEGLQALLKRADEALFAAKSAGRNRVECARKGVTAAPVAATT